MSEPGATASPGPGETGAQWQMRVVDTIDDTIATVQDRVVRPLLLVARAIVFGIIIATMALVISVLFSIALVRVLDVYAFRGRVWASDVVVGGVFTLGGLALWTRRRARGDAQGS